MAPAPARPSNPVYDRLARNARRGWVAVLVAAALVALLAFDSARRYVDALASVEHTRQVDGLLGRTFADLLGVGYGARGYVIAGNETFLAPFELARRALPDDVAELRRLTADNPRQQARLDELEFVVGERIRISAELVDLRRVGRADAAVENVSEGKGKYAADRARALIEAMRAEEGVLLDARRDALRRAEAATGVTVAGAFALLLLAAAAGCVRFPRMVRELGRAQHELQVNRELYSTLLKSLPDAVALLFDHELRFVLVEGDRLLSAVGLDKRRLTGALVVDVVSSRNRPRFEGAYRAALGGETSTFEFALAGRDLLVTVAPVRDDAGAIVAGLALARDVTERKRAEEALEAERATLRAVLDAMQDAVVVADLAGRVALMNPAARAALGEPGPDGAHPPYVGGGHMFRADGETPLPLEVSPMARALRGESVDGVEIVLRNAEHPQGRWHSLNATPIRGEAGAVRGAVCVGRDVTDQRRAREALRQLSTQDELTGLYNRRGFLALADERARLAAHAGQAFALLFIDLNGMKQINDVLGHEEGDRALADAASLLRRTFREAALVARPGGDEFVVFVSDADGPRADHLLERLRADLDRHNDASGRKFRLSLSAGVALFDPARPETVEQLLGRADARMYANKRARPRSAPPVRAPGPGGPPSFGAPRSAEGPPARALRLSDVPSSGTLRLSDVPSSGTLRLSDVPSSGTLRLSEPAPSAGRA